jgi:predicted esterase
MSDERHITVAKTARYYTVGDMENAGEVWFVIHGYAQLAARFLRRFQSLADDTRLMVAPEALNRYYFETAPGVHAPDAGVGGTWMTREEREYEITDYVAYLDTLYQRIKRGLTREPTRVVAVGFSQGAATAARWAARGSASLSDVILVGGFLPPEIDPHAGALHGAALTFLHGRTDPYATADRIRKESDRLTASGLKHAVVEYNGAHEITDDAIQAMLRS